MYSEVVEALLAMGECTGTQEAFLRASVTTIQGVLECSAEHADRILQELTGHNQVAIELTPGGELPLSLAGIPTARWYWYAPSAA